MRWASALSERVELSEALREVGDGVVEALGGEPDLVIAFASDHYRQVEARLPEALQRVLSPRVVIGSAASGVIGHGREVERREALSVLAARLPGVGLHPFHFELAPDSRADWDTLLGLSGRVAQGMLLLSDPFSIDIEAVLGSLDRVYPETAKSGALVSGAREPGRSTLFLDGQAVHEGVVGLAFSGELEMRTLVAHGCRPIGEPMIVTDCQDMVIRMLNVGRPVDALREVMARLAPQDQELARHSLYLGIAAGSVVHQREAPGYLIRDIAGVDPVGGALAVYGGCKPYDVIQFHVRDSRTCSQDLNARLRAFHRDDPAAARQRGALLFSCSSRGEGFYGEPNHESDLFCRRAGHVPLSGFFGNGELGPVGGVSYLHANSSAFALFCEPEGGAD